MLKLGDKVKVLDTTLIKEYTGDLVDYYVEAHVISVSSSKHLVDVMIIHSKRISKGHFIPYVRPFNVD